MVPARTAGAVAHETWPELLGQDVNGDAAPAGSVALVFGAIVLAIAGGVLAVVIAAARGNRIAAGVAAGVMACFARFWWVQAGNRAEPRRCVVKTYSDTTLCIDRSTAATRDRIVWAVPAIAATLGYAWQAAAIVERRADRGRMDGLLAHEPRASASDGNRRSHDAPT